jgi:hypothetical protein
LIDPELPRLARRLQLRERLVEPLHVAGVMLVVVDLQDLRAQEAVQRVLGIRQIR